MEWIAGVLGLVVSVAATVLAWLAKGRSEHARRQRAKDLTEISLALGPLSETQSIVTRRPTAEIPFTPELLKDIERTIVARVEAALPLASRDEMQKEIKNHMEEVSERIKKIEDRFPEEAQIEMIASINDALLAERIDQLSKQVQALESRTLSKWDVALTVGVIISGIIIVVGATYGVLKALGKVP